MSLTDIPVHIRGACDSLSSWRVLVRCIRALYAVLEPHVRVVEPPPLSSNCPMASDLSWRFCFVKEIKNVVAVVRRAQKPLCPLHLVATLSCCWQDRHDACINPVSGKKKKVKINNCCFRPEEAKSQVPNQSVVLFLSIIVAKIKSELTSLCQLMDETIRLDV